MLFSSLVHSAAFLAIQAIALPTSPIAPRDHNERDTQAIAGMASLEQGQLQGVKLDVGQTQWLGIRYAAAPVGDLRWAAPQPPPAHEGVLVADKVQSGCSGLGPDEGDEDCLYVDVMAPSNATADSKLPVFVWIPGGGNQGSSTGLNASSFIQSAGNNVVVVDLSYRVGAFGFLASDEIRKNGSLNVGLLDQRAAIKWVHNNIAHFGGDPDHIVIGGQSAGAGSVVQHLTAYGGNNTDAPFVGAISESQSLYMVRTVEQSQFQYDLIVKNTTCANATDSLACLRGLSSAELYATALAQPFPDGAGGDPVYYFNPVIDDDFVRDYPARSIQKGNFAKVPAIFGNVADEGAIFAPGSLKNRTDTENFLRDTFPALNRTVLDQYDRMYNLSDETAEKINWQQKGGISYGETRYECPAHWIPDAMLGHQDNETDAKGVWTYRYKAATPQQKAGGGAVTHGSELPAVWGQDDKNYGPGADLHWIVGTVQSYWTSFVKTLDPNEQKDGSLPTWETWKKDGERMGFGNNGTAMEQVDAAQRARCRYLASIAVPIGQ